MSAREHHPTQMLFSFEIFPLTPYFSLDPMAHTLSVLSLPPFAFQIKRDGLRQGRPPFLVILPLQILVWAGRCGTCFRLRLCFLLPSRLYWSFSIRQLFRCVSRCFLFVPPERKEDYVPPAAFFAMVVKGFPLRLSFWGNAMC